MRCCRGLIVSKSEVSGIIYGVNCDWGGKFCWGKMIDQTGVAKVVGLCRTVVSIVHCGCIE